MNAYIPTKDDLQKLISEAVQETVLEILPSAIRKATRKKWLTTSEVMEILQCSRRHVQYLRDSGKLPFRQDKKTIRYNIDEVETYLNKGKINVQEVS